MKTRSLIATALLIQTFSLASAVAASDLKLNISLSPAGSFVAESQAVEVRGSTERAGDQFVAHNIALKLDTLKTGIELRDDHMKHKYLETDKYPEAILTQAMGKGGNFTGQLMVHGVTKPVQGTYQLVADQFVCTFTASINDFGIAKVKYMGVGVSDSVKVEVSIPAAPMKGPAAAPAKM
jgi:polyisoprenoid-binding protein YceI